MPMSQERNVPMSWEGEKRRQGKNTVYPIDLFPPLFPYHATTAPTAKKQLDSLKRKLKDMEEERDSLLQELEDCEYLSNNI